MLELASTRNPVIWASHSTSETTVAMATTKHRDPQRAVLERHPQTALAEQENEKNSGNRKTWMLQTRTLAQTRATR